MFIKKIKIDNNSFNVKKLISTTKNLSKSFFYDFFHVVVGEGLGTSSGNKNEYNINIIINQQHN